MWLAPPPRKSLLTTFINLINRMVGRSNNLDAEGSSKGAIEIHIENLIKNYQNIWTGYKRRLLQVRTILKELESHSRLSIIEGDSFIRFKSDDNYASLNFLFFVYEIGKVFPTLVWRHLIGSGTRLNYVLLKKPVSFLPAYSFSLDQQATLLYWGEGVPILSAEDLKNLKLNNFILKTNHPDSVEISASNICWPKYASIIPKDQELERWATHYLFNSLMPPILDVDGVWSESPFILVGDRTIRFLTIHKTLCSIDNKTIRPIPGGEFVNAKAFVIDRNFNLRSIRHVDVPVECIGQLVGKESTHEVVFVKDMRLRYEPALNEQSPYIRYTVYPFESINIFGGENYGPLLSITSMVLREFYLRSSDPFYFTLTLDEFKKYLAKILNRFPFSHANELGLKLIESREGLITLLSLLGVYDSYGRSFLYLHPALLECYLYNIKGKINKTNLRRLQRIVYEYYQKAGSLTSHQELFLIRDSFKKEFGFDPNYSGAQRFIRSFYNLVNLCIPLSKSFNSWAGGNCHA